MSLLRAVAISYVVGFSALGLGGLYYTRKVKKLDYKDCPSEFKKYFQPSDYHGFYQKQIRKPIDMQKLVEGIFKQPLYNLEYGISETSPPTEIQLRKGEQIGNLVIEVIRDDHLIFRYMHKDFNFRLFLQNNKANVIFGFADYTGDVLEGLGSQIFIPMLLEGGTSENDSGSK